MDIDASTKVGFDHEQDQESVEEVTSFEIFLRKLKSVYSYCERIFHNFQLTIFYRLVLPFFTAALMLGAFFAVVTYAERFVLPSIYFYNLLQMCGILCMELAVKAVRNGYTKMESFKQSWNLVYGRASLRKVQETSKGTMGKFSRYINLSLYVLEIVTYVLYFLSTFDPTRTSLGQYACNEATYSSDILGGFTANPNAISGDIDFALIYMYGIPLQDGIAAGFAPWPDAAPLDDFEIKGMGPILVMETVCQPDLEDWDGTAPISEGNGFMLKNTIVAKRTFNVDLDVLLPTNGFDGIDSTTDWVKQSCAINGYLGKAMWTFEYTVDEWEMVTAGLAASLIIGDAQINAVNNGFYSNNLIKMIEKAEMNGWDKFSFATNTSEGRAIIDAVIHAIDSTMSNNWYKPAQSGTFSNMLSWATQPDGFYYANLTERGLNAALGAVLHQVWLQYSPIVGECEYFGSDGAGFMNHNAYLKMAVQALLAITLLILLLSFFGMYLLYPIPKGNTAPLKDGAKLLLHEDFRHKAIFPWIARLFMGETSPIIEEIATIPIRYGRLPSASEEIVKYGIGPLKLVKRLANGKSGSLKSSSTDSDDSDKQQKLEKFFGEKKSKRQGYDKIGEKPPKPLMKQMKELKEERVPLSNPVLFVEEPGTEKKRPLHSGSLSILSQDKTVTKSAERVSGTSTNSIHRLSAEDFKVEEGMRLSPKSNLLAPSLGSGTVGVKKSILKKTNTSISISNSEGQKEPTIKVRSDEVLPGANQDNK